MAVAGPVVPFSVDVRRKYRTTRTLIAQRGLGALIQLVIHRVGKARARLRRWLLRDRAWIGRVFAMTGQRIWIEGCRFDFRHTIITDQVRCRALLGRYERSERQLLRQYVDPGLPVIELGGGLGVIACLANRILKNPTQHVVVEANPSLIPVLAHHRQSNDCKFTIVHAAVDYRGLPQVALRVDSDFLSARISGANGMQVPTITLREVFGRFPFSHCTLICDIEGAEVALIAHDAQLLAERVACVIMEVHPEFCTEQERLEIRARLRDAGFIELAAVRKVRVFTNVRHGQPWDSRYVGP
jgi:FkbM family methyltransferase